MNSSINLKSGQNALFMKVFILAVVIVVVALIGLFFQKSSLSSVFVSGFKDYQKSSQLLKDVSSVHANLYRIKGMVAAGQDKQEIAKFSDKQITVLAESVNQAKKALESDIDEEQKRFYQAILGNLIEYQKSAVQVIRLAPMNTGSAYLTSANEKMDATISILNQLLENEIATAESEYGSGNLVFYIIAIALIVLLVLYFLLIPSFIKKMLAGSVIEPLEETTAALKEFAGGKYNRTLSWEASDTIGELVDAVNALKVKMSTGTAPKTAAQESSSDQKTAASENASVQSEEKTKSLSDMIKKSPDQDKDTDKLVISSRKAIDKLQDI